MRFRRASRDVLYVPFYLRHFNVSEKIILALLIFFSSMAVGVMPIVYAFTHKIESNSQSIYSGEAELWRVFGEEIDESH